MTCSYDVFLLFLRHIPLTYSYADYYYVEALMRLRDMLTKEK